MSYRRDFTIGLRETQDFYLSLVLGRWGKGIIGFGAVGALAGLLYTGQAELPPPLRAAVILAAALAAAGATALALVVSTRWKVKAQVRRSGRSEYIQETEINGFGIHVTVGRDKARMSFEDLARVRETGRAFYLFLSESQAWILPKRQMEDREAECAQLRELFRAVIERGKLRLKK